ncbi:hypothetical protein [Confluentibacter sediminis]|uniref:hypothetical protein n=1 Tax=Confluentibacter sediminis TaxID=2219045 RepID=UPI001C7399BB|nr:hypothetical protein [Confluentibacter sediminis]
MNLTNQHKALLITFFLSGTVVLSIFNFHLKKHDELASESYYEMEPEKELTEEEVKILETLAKLNNAKAETNSAFNETAENKQFAQAYKPIAPPEDYEYPKPSENNDDGDSDNSNATGEQKPLQPAINKEELSSFSKVKDLLKKQQAESVNTKSTISFSLVNRTKVYIPIPVYLCEVDGKIVINITVNAEGNVTDAYLNNSSTSNNECLIGHALEYAKNSQFSADPSKKTQIGSITFYFIGKD